jgi:hypothetical protein
LRNTPALWEVEDQKFQKQHQEEDLEEIKQPWETFDGEHTLEPDIEGFLPCLSSYPLCTQVTNQQIVEDLDGMTKEDIQSGDNEQVNQVHHDYIELWFQTPSFTLQQFLTSYQSKKLVSHILVSIKAYLPSLNMNLFVIMLCTWIHWKYSYT